MTESKRERSEAREEQELKVIDRRLFTADGQLRDDAVDEQPAETTPVAEKSPATPERTEPEAGAFERRPVEEPTGVDVTMLVNAMAEPALLFLGELQPPGADKPTVDLERARIQIDLLDLLRVKCRGNLTAEEEGLLDRILYQLRMLYVARAQRPES